MFPLFPHRLLCFAEVGIRPTMQGHAPVQLPAEAHAEDHSLPPAHQKCESLGGLTQAKDPPG